MSKQKKAMPNWIWTTCGAKEKTITLVPRKLWRTTHFRWPLFTGDNKSQRPESRQQIILKGLTSLLHEVNLTATQLLGVGTDTLNLPSLFIIYGHPPPSPPTDMISQLATGGAPAAEELVLLLTPSSTAAIVFHTPPPLNCEALGWLPVRQGGC